MFTCLSFSLLNPQRLKKHLASVTSQKRRGKLGKIDSRFSGNYFSAKLLLLSVFSEAQNVVSVCTRKFPVVKLRNWVWGFDRDLQRKVKSVCDAHVWKVCRPVGEWLQSVWPRDCLFPIPQHCLCLKHKSKIQVWRECDTYRGTNVVSKTIMWNGW